MKRLLKSKAGVTVLEGVIALGLLALVTAGAFGVLLSASRQTTQPDVQEEMSWAVEKANTLLHAYAMYLGEDDDLRNMRNHLPEGLQNGLCGGDASPMSEGEHEIKCLLPPLCDRQQSEFTYKVGQIDTDQYNITYEITCNGYTL